MALTKKQGSQKSVTHLLEITTIAPLTWLTPWGPKRHNSRGAGLESVYSGFTQQESRLVSWNSYKPSCSKWEGPGAREQSLRAKSLACAHQPWACHCQTRSLFSVCAHQVGAAVADSGTYWAAPPHGLALRFVPSYFMWHVSAPWRRGTEGRVNAEETISWRGQEQERKHLSAYVCFSDLADVQ